MTSLKSPRLSLEPTNPAYFEGFWRSVLESVDELRVWMPWAVEPDEKVALDFLTKAEHEWNEGLERHFTLFYQGEVCGQCSLDTADAMYSSYEIGYWLRSDLCGRGLMTEAARAVVSFGFDEVGMHRIALLAGTENAASIRVAEKLGFKREGVLREACRGAGGFYDAYAYGLLRSDPRS